MSDSAPGNRASGRRRPSPLAYVIPVAAILLPTLVAVRNWDQIRDAGWLQNVAGVLAGLAIVVGVAVYVIRSQARTRSQAAPGGWAGLAMVEVASLTKSPTLQDVAPREGALSTIAFAKGAMIGRLYLGDDVHFEPGPRGRLFGAKPFRLSSDQLRDLRTKDRFLQIVVRGEDTTPVLVKVVNAKGLRQAARRLFR